MKFNTRIVEVKMVRAGSKVNRRAAAILFCQDKEGKTQEMNGKEKEIKEASLGRFAVLPERNLWVLPRKVWKKRNLKKDVSKMSECKQANNFAAFVWESPLACPKTPWQKFLHLTIFFGRRDAGTHSR